MEFRDVTKGTAWSVSTLSSRELKSLGGIWQSFKSRVRNAFYWRRPVSLLFIDSHEEGIVIDHGEVGQLGKEGNQALQNCIATSCRPVSSSLGCSIYITQDWRSWIGWGSERRAMCNNCLKPSLDWCFSGSQSCLFCFHCARLCTMWRWAMMCSSRMHYTQQCNECLGCARRVRCPAKLCAALSCICQACLAMLYRSARQYWLDLPWSIGQWPFLACFWRLESPSALKIWRNSLDGLTNFDEHWLQLRLSEVVNFIFLLLFGLENSSNSYIRFS